MCSSRKLGKMLVDLVSELKNTINDMEATSHKSTYKYNTLGRIRLYSSRVKSILGFFSLLIRHTLKIIIATATLAIGLLAFLFFTMESKHTIINDINMDRTFLKKQMSEFERQKSNYIKIEAKIEAIKETTLTRQQKIGLLNLIAEKRKVQEYMEKTLLSIKNREKIISVKMKKLEEINRKSLLQRLFRR